MLYGDRNEADLICVEPEVSECHHRRNAEQRAAKKKGGGKRLLYRGKALKSH